MTFGKGDILRRVFSNEDTLSIRYYKVVWIRAEDRVYVMKDIDGKIHEFTEYIVYQEFTEYIVYQEFKEAETRGS